MDASQPSPTSLRSVSGRAAPPLMWEGKNSCRRKLTRRLRRFHNPQAEFDKPSDVVKDSGLSLTEKKEALENLEQDAHQLMTASNEGMAPENDHVAEHEPKLDEVVKAQQRIGEKPQHKPTQ